MSAFPEAHKQILEVDLAMPKKRQRGEKYSYQTRMNWYEKDNRKYMTA